MVKLSCFKLRRVQVKTLILIRFLDAEREENTLMKQKFMDLALEISKKVVVLLKMMKKYCLFPKS